MIGIISCVKNDTSSALTWRNLLIGDDKSTSSSIHEDSVVIFSDLVDDEEQLSKCQALLVVGIEPLRQISNAKSQGQLVKEKIEEQLQGIDVDELTSEELDSLITKLAFQALVQTDSAAGISDEIDEEEEALSNSLLHSVIRDFHSRQLRVVGIGAGSLEVSRAFGGKVTDGDVQLRLESVQNIREGLNLAFQSDALPDSSSTSTFARIIRSNFSELPSRASIIATISSTTESSPVVVAFTLSSASTEDAPGGDSRSPMSPRPNVFCINASPEVAPESIIEEWLPLLDDHLLLSASEAAQTIESLKRQQLDGDVSDSLQKIRNEEWIELVRSFLSKDLVRNRQSSEEEKEERSAKGSSVTVDNLQEVVRLMEKRLKFLEDENHQLRAELRTAEERLSSLLAVRSGNENSETPIASQVLPKTVLSPNDRSIRSLLIGIDIHSTQEELDYAEATLTRISKEQPFTDEANSISRSSNASVLALCYTNEGDLVYGGTDRILHIVNDGLEAAQPTQTITLDAPPIFIVASPRSVPIEIAVGTLSGAIERFTRGADGALVNRRKLESPHKKHITGLAFDPSGIQRLASVSRDGILVFWSSDGNQLSQFGFHPDKSPECCSSVMLDGKPYVAVAKRDDHRVSLVPFDSEHQDAKQLYFSLNEDEKDQYASFTPLAMCSLKDLPIVAIATDKSRIIVYDIRNGGRRLREFWGHMCDEFARPSISWDDRGKWLAITSTPNKVFLFKVSQPTSAPVVLEDHSAIVRCLAFNTSIDQETGEQHQYLTTGSFDKKIKIRQMRS